MVDELREDYELQDLGKYYKSDHLFEFEELTRFRVNKVLNVGCGRATSVHRYENWMGIDYNRNLLELWRELGVEDRCFVEDAANLPFRDRAFDATVSSDFFEHLPTDKIITVTKELKRVGVSGAHVIHATPQSGFRGVGGRNLHVSGNIPLSRWKTLMGCEVRTLRGNYLIATW